MATFMDMIQAMMAQGGGGPTPEAAPTPMPGNPGRPMPNPMGTPTPMPGMPGRTGAPYGQPSQHLEEGDAMALLALLASVVGARQNQPDAGDVYDYHNSNGDPGIMGLFGSNPPPLRQPPPGVNRRRGF